MQINKYLTAGLLATFAFTACGGGAGGGHPGTTPPNVPNQANLTVNVLQFAVGTANIPGAAAPGLNVVATYRQPKGQYAPGDAGSLVNSATLTVAGSLPTTPGAEGPFDATIQGTPYAPGVLNGVGPGVNSPPTPPGSGGPSSAEAGGHVMTSTSQLGSNSTTFGFAGGVFGLGIEPFNYQNGDLPASEAPYMVPLYDTLKGTTGDPNAFEPWGGPPAFNPTLNGASGDVGISLGLDVFQSVPATPGEYELTVSVPANTGTVTKTAQATLTPVELPAATAPAFVPDGLGGGTLAYVAPAGVTEAYIEVINYGPVQPTLAQQTAAYGMVPSTSYDAVNSCDGASTAAPQYYTFEATASGTYTLPDGSYCTAAANSAAAVNPPPTGGALAIPTTGDQFTVQVIGFDYPAYEMSYPNSLGQPAPTYLGASGNDDITISPAQCNTDPAGDATGTGLSSAPCTVALNTLSTQRKSPSAHTLTKVRYR